MPPARTKCTLCRHDIGKSPDFIQCTSCNSWYHIQCVDLPEKYLALFKDKKTFPYSCVGCRNSIRGDVQEEVRVLSEKINEFIKSSQEDREVFKNSITESLKSSQDDRESFKISMNGVLSDFKEEVSTCLQQMKSDIVACSKLINNMDSAMTAKIKSLEIENNILHRRFNRGDIVLSGMPSGLDDLESAVVSLCGFYGVTITKREINQVCYLGNQSRVLVKFVNVSIRDKIMKDYFKERSLRICDVLGGDITSRVYLNDHYSPAASNLHFLCRKLLRQKIISKFRIMNGDRVKAKLTMPDGKEILRDIDECGSLYSESRGGAV